MKLLCKILKIITDQSFLNISKPVTYRLEWWNQRKIKCRLLCHRQAHNEKEEVSAVKTHEKPKCEEKSVLLAEPPLLPTLEEYLTFCQSTTAILQEMKLCICKKKVASVFCDVDGCKKALCEVCYRRHLKMISTKSHQSYLSFCPSCGDYSQRLHCCMYCLAPSLGRFCCAECLEHVHYDDDVSHSLSPCDDFDFSSGPKAATKSQKKLFSITPPKAKQLQPPEETEINADHNEHWEPTFDPASVCLTKLTTNEQMILNITRARALLETVAQPLVIQLWKTQWGGGT